MGSCCSGYHIAEDHIHMDIAACNIKVVISGKYKNLNKITKI